MEDHAQDDGQSARDVSEKQHRLPSFDHEHEVDQVSQDVSPKQPYNEYNEGHKLMLRVLLIPFHLENNGQTQEERTD